ncbi:unnamed protein product [Mucor hiemalis]
MGGRENISCDKPLQLYLIVFVVRVGLSLPLTIYQHLFLVNRRGRRGRRGANRVNDNNDEQPDASSSATTTETTTDTPIEGTTTSQRPSTLVSGWAERLKSLLDLFAILWFIVGNYLIFSSSICSVNAALYYYTILTWILFGYTILVIPLLACASVIFCLPCVLVTMRTFNINVSNVMKGGSKEELAKIPIFRFKSTLSDDTPTTDQQQQQQQQPQNNNNPRMKKANYFRRLMKRRQSEENIDSKDKVNHPHLTIPKAEDAVCSICLSEYENDELICKLWCDHIYHESCVVEWLALNSKCPLCKRDFRGKDFADDQNSGDEEERV